MFANFAILSELPNVLNDFVIPALLRYMCNNVVIFIVIVVVIVIVVNCCYCC